MIWFKYANPKPDRTCQKNIAQQVLHDFYQMRSNVQYQQLLHTSIPYTHAGVNVWIFLLKSMILDVVCMLWKGLDDKSQWHPLWGGRLSFANWLSVWTNKKIMLPWSRNYNPVGKIVKFILMFRIEIKQKSKRCNKTRL